MTTISDPRLRELHSEFVRAIDRINCNGAEVARTEDAFILALNERLRLAEEMAETALHLISTGSGSSDLMGAVMAYRKVSQ